MGVVFFPLIVRHQGDALIQGTTLT
jgi:hypothetical protein